MTPFIQRSARDDILRQYRYFLDVDQAGLADRFIAAVNDTIDKIPINPHAGSPRYFENPALVGLRGRRVEGFGEFRVYYLIREDVLTIIRVLHNRRDLGAIFDDQSVEEPDGE